MTRPHTGRELFPPHSAPRAKGPHGNEPTAPPHDETCCGDQAPSDDDEAAQKSKLATRLHLLGGSVRVNDAEKPQAAAAELHRHAHRGSDHGQVKVGAEELQASDADQVRNALALVAP